MKNDTPMHAIRMKCLECSGGSANEVKLCEMTKCTLHPYRSGHKPPKDTEWISDGKVSQMTDEQKAKAAERLKAVRAKQP